VTSFFIRSNIANLNARPDTGSEQVSQAICGMTVDVLEEDGDFSLIRTPDRYEGWTRKHHLVPAWDTSEYLVTATAPLFTDVYKQAAPASDLVTKLPCSSRVFLAHAASVGDYVPILLPDRTPGYVHRYCLDIAHDGASSPSELADPAARKSLDIQSIKRDIVAAVGKRSVDIGRRFIGTPYLWGGTSPFGIDCSGFVQLCYRLSGVQLLRDADPQFRDKRFERIDEDAPFDEAPLLCGDLVAFSKDGSGRITHIGLADGAGLFIHSSGGRGVYFDWCTHPNYLATFVGAVRLSADADLAIDAA
jgi:hypothetical protein